MIASRPWSAARLDARFARREAPDAPISVECELGDDGVPVSAVFDTGSAWTVVPRELAERAGGLDVLDDDVRWIHTRFGMLDLRTGRIRLVFPAVDGDTVAIEATVLLGDESWPADRVVLGFHGCLSRLRVAWDPGASADDEPAMWAELTSA